MTTGIPLLRPGRLADPTQRETGPQTERTRIMPEPASEIKEKRIPVLPVVSESNPIMIHHKVSSVVKRDSTLDLSIVYSFSKTVS